MPKVNVPCHVCRSSLHVGKLWLRGGDYLDCPECDGTGRITGFMEIVAPRKHFVMGPPIVHRSGPRPTGIVIAGRV